jgi:DNA helicase-2/ATP-dependent DNA helicase PcrA
VSNSYAYIQAADELKKNEGQWAAYQSEGHCVVLAGPGSGKTKTLTIKLARILAEEVQDPRGVACITYNNECAREIESRLSALGIEPGGRLFVGTVHSFSLTQIVLPYHKVAGLNLPDDFTVANRAERAVALERAYKKAIDGPENPQTLDFAMGTYRRSILDRESKAWHTNNPRLATLVEAFEAELRAMERIDFDDMPLLALRALKQNVWLRRALLAKFPVLVVDEYQDLGRALHSMVMGLCFSAGMRLFAVGDADQSIYGFTGAHPKLLERLSSREDVETVQLRMNYRCGSSIVQASSYALGEDRDFQAPEDAPEGTIFFHPQGAGYQQQADHLFEHVLPGALARMPHCNYSDVAILYPDANLGDIVAAAATRYSIETVRADKNAIYPRANRLMRWLEQCAKWSCGGWQSGDPRFSKLCNDARRLFSEALQTEEKNLELQQLLLSRLWNQRDSKIPLHAWLQRLNTEVIASYAPLCRAVHDEVDVLEQIIQRTGPDGDLDGMTLAQFSGEGGNPNRVNLSTLHSSKGREFAIVVMFAMDHGKIPWFNVNDKKIRESRRTFYVGFTRAETELHLMYSASQLSPFVAEVAQRLQVV